MANWRVYINREYGISFKYPSYWLLDQDLHVPNRRLVFKVQGQDPNKAPLLISVDLEVSNVDDDRTAKQWFADIIAKNTSSTMRYEYLLVGGYPALKIVEPSVAYEYYNIIAPSPDAPSRRVTYMVVFSNIGQGVTNPYHVSDRFIQTESANFHTMISAIKFNE